MNRFSAKLTLLVPVCFLIVALFFVYLSIVLSRETIVLADPNSPAFFPAIISFLLVIFSILDLLATRKRSSDGLRTTLVPGSLSGRWGILSDLVISLIIILYILLLPYAGFLVMTVFLMLSIMFFVGERKVIKLTVYPVIVAVLMYYAAVRPFHTPIPFLPWD
jgi:hypothetical protein